MPARAPPQNELQELQLKASEKTDETLMCTRRMMTLIDETKEAGIRTIVTLDDQGEQLEAIERNMDQVNADLSIAEKTMHAMERCCGLFNFPCNKNGGFKDDNTWKGNEDGKVVNDQPHRVLDNRNGIGPQKGYIVRITNDEREDEMEENLCYLNTGIDNLKHMAYDMGSEIVNHNEAIERVNQKSGNNIARLEIATKRSEKILKL